MNRLGRPDVKCHKCGEEMTHHDDGLSARRREVRGGCLICGRPVGDISKKGNCTC